MSASDIKGIQVLEKKLRPEKFGALWDSIHVDAHIKEALLSQAILNFTFRPHVAAEAVPLHGIILLVGPPGLGKRLSRRVSHPSSPKCSTISTSHTSRSSPIR